MCYSTLCGALRSTSEAFGLEPLTMPSMAINAFAGGAVNTAAAVFIGGATFGAAVTTVGLPAGALAALGTLLNSLCLKVIDNCNLVNNTPGRTAEGIEYSLRTVNVGILALKDVAVTLVVGALTSLSPIFRINLLFVLVTTQVPNLLLGLHFGFQIPRQNLAITLPNYWMAGAFIRA